MIDSYIMLSAKSLNMVLKKDDEPHQKRDRKPHLTKLLPSNNVKAGHYRPTSETALEGHIHVVATRLVFSWRADSGQ